MRPTVPILHAALWLWAAQAHASGFSSARFTGPQGHPLTGNPTALYYNPAALSNGTGTRLLVDGVLALRSIKYERTLSEVPEPADGPGVSLGKASLLNPIGGGTLAGATRVGDLSLGAGVFVPFGGSVDWPEKDELKGSQYIGAQDGVQRFHAISGQLGSIYLSTGAAYEFGNTGLSIGVAGNLVYSFAKLTRAQTALYDDDPSIEGRTYLDVSGWHGSAALGLMLEAIDDTLWLGASYQAPPRLYRTMKLKGEWRTQFPNGLGRDDVVLFQRLPDVLRFGARYRVSAPLELRLFGDFIRWSVLDHQCAVRREELAEAKPGKHPCDLDARGVQPEGAARPAAVAQRGFQNTGSVTLGASYWPREGLELMGNLGWDGNAVPDRTLEPSFYDADDFELALGVRVDLGAGLRLAVSYTHLQFLPRDNRGKGGLQDFGSASKLPPAEGTFRAWLGIFNANLELAL